MHSGTSSCHYGVILLDIRDMLNERFSQFFPWLVSLKDL